MKKSPKTVPRICVLLGLALGLSMPVAAETFLVTKTSDGNGPCDVNDCALREAIIAANATPELDRIELPAGVYLLTIPAADKETTVFAPETGDLDIREDLEIVGALSGGTVILGNTEYRVLEIGFAAATFHNIEITRGQEPNDFGGCVRMIGADVTFINSSITNCFCPGGGGGLYVVDSAVTFLNSTVSGNVSEYRGGGIYHSGFKASDDLNIINSTISGNRAQQWGGGIYRALDGTATISNSTIANNEAPFGDAMYLNFPFKFTYVENSIIEGKCRGLSLQTRGGNLGGPDTIDHCFKFSLLNDIADEDLGLAPLGFYGGLTRTHALFEHSQAIDAANADQCEATDQRGVARPVDAGCDSGAFEGVAPLPTEVPTLGGWGALGFVLLLAGAASRSLALSRLRRN